MHYNQPVGVVFTAALSAVSVSAAQDVFEIVAPSTSRVRIREVRIGQYSDAGDAQAEILSVLIMRGHTTTGSGGAAVTPSNVRPYSRAADCTVTRNNTTVATGGSPVTMIADTMNVQAGFLCRPDIHEAIQLAASERLVVRITAPADAITVNATLVFEELGLAAV